MILLTLLAAAQWHAPSLPGWSPSICGGCWFNTDRPLIPDTLDRYDRRVCRGRPGRKACIRAGIQRMICTGPRRVPDGDPRLDLFRGNGESEEELRVRVTIEAAGCGRAELCRAERIAAREGLIATAPTNEEVAARIGEDNPTPMCASPAAARRLLCHGPTSHIPDDDPALTLYHYGTLEERKFDLASDRSEACARRETTEPENRP